MPAAWATFGNAASRFCDTTQRDQEDTGLIGILPCGSEVFGGEPDYLLAASHVDHDGHIPALTTPRHTPTGHLPK